MALAQDDIFQVQKLIEQALNDRPEIINANVRYELELCDRMVRVEEELRHQRELMMEGFKQMEKRFEQIDKRFEQVEKRFEQIDKRFEQVDKRFEQVDKRFEQVDKRFEQMQTEMNKRFEDFNLRFERLITWMFGSMLTVGGLIIAAIKYLP